MSSRSEVGGGLCGNHVEEWPPRDDWQENRAGDFRVFYEKICAVKQIGQGGFGKVYRGHRCVKIPGQGDSRGNCCVNAPYAIKVLDLTNSSGHSSSSTTNSKRTKSRIKLEIDVHVKLCHNKNIVTPFKVFKWPQEKSSVAILCMEYCSLGDAESFFKQRVFSESLAKRLAQHVVRGLCDLKSKGFFHRDVKASNVFVAGSEQEPQFKLGDFGLVACIDECNYEVCGTPSAMAPEMDGKHAYTEKIDIWSLGILLYTKLLRRHPFRYEQKAKTVDRIRAQHQPWSFPQDIHLSFDLKDVIKRMLTVDPAARISLEETDRFLEDVSQIRDSGFVTSSTLSSGMMTTASSTNHLRYHKAPMLPMVSESSGLYRYHATPVKDAVSSSQPIRPPTSSTNTIIAPHITQASPMPSTCHSRTVATLHHPPLSTRRLRPSTKVHQFSNGSAKIHSDGSVRMEFLKTKEVIQNGRRTKLNDGKDLYVISPDGLTIEVAKGSESQNVKVYSYLDLPSKYWSKYNYAAKFVGIVREQTPKITYYSDKAVCRLMENGPDPNFDMTLYASGVRFCYHAIKGIRITWPPAGGGKTEQYSAQTLCLDPHHELAEEWSLFLREKQRLVKLEKLLEQFAQDEGGSTFPQTIGKRPSSLSA